MKASKIVQNIPNEIILPNGKKLVRRTIYEAKGGKVLQMTPELEKKVESIRKQIAELRMQLYEMEKTSSMFIKTKAVRDRMMGRMNYISTDIQRLKRELRQILIEYKNAQ